MSFDCFVGIAYFVAVTATVGNFADCVTSGIEGFAVVFAVHFECVG